MNKSQIQWLRIKNLSQDEQLESPPELLEEGARWCSEPLAIHFGVIDTRQRSSVLQ